MSNPHIVNSELVLVSFLGDSCIISIVLNGAWENVHYTGFIADGITYTDRLNNSI